jgi:hypothetical protein
MEYPDNYGIGAAIEKASIEHRLAQHKQQCIEERDYLDRVALEAMKILLQNGEWRFSEDPERNEEYCSDVASDAYAVARAMLKARSQGGAE